MNQQTLSDMEYSCRKKKTKREEFLEIMEEIIPWDEWIEIIKPYYPAGKRGRRPIDLELMLRMYLLQVWFNLSDPGTEDAIYDSYAMRKFIGINFLEDSVPDETTLCNFRHLLEEHGLNKVFFDASNRVMVKSGHIMKGGTIVDATIIDAPSSTKNAQKQRAPEMHSTKKGNYLNYGKESYWQSQTPHSWRQSHRWTSSWFDARSMGSQHDGFHQPLQRKNQGIHGQKRHCPHQSL